MKDNILVLRDRCSEFSNLLVDKLKQNQFVATISVDLTMKSMLRINPEIVVICEYTREISKEILYRFHIPFVVLNKTKIPVDGDFTWFWSLLNKEQPGVCISDYHTNVAIFQKDVIISKNDTFKSITQNIDDTLLRLFLDNFEQLKKHVSEHKTFDDVKMRLMNEYMGFIENRPYKIDTKISDYIRS